MRISALRLLHHYPASSLGLRGASYSLAPLIAFMLFQAGPRAAPLAAQEVAREPAGSDVKCLTITEAEVLRYSSGGSLIDLLRFRIPGLQVTAANWRSRTASSMGLRGSNSIVGPREPLVFVDGLRLPQPGGIEYLDLIDPLDVVRIELLPGAAATTLYGTNASNGVILIYTKMGVGDASGSGDAKGRCP